MTIELIETIPIFVPITFFQTEQIMKITIPNLKITLEEAMPKDAAIVYDAIATHRDYLKTWLPFAADLDEKDEEIFLSSLAEQPYEDKNIAFMIKTENNFCGFIGFVQTDNVNHRTEIGYWLLPEYQGKGIMTECVRRLCLWAVKERNMHRIQIKCAVGNHPSNAIPKRLGFHLDGTERDGELMYTGKYVDLNVYSILDHEIKD